jgi:dTDP-4-amino-4,6-dideoxygalactose transaminase
MLGTKTRHFVCKCGYTSKSKTGIRLHKRVTHGEDTKDLDRRAADYLRCKTCRAVFDSTSQLTTHLRHTGHLTH